MEGIIDIIKIIFLGIIEGISEWLPISSTGHMLLVDEFINFKGSEDFKDVFFVVIQLGAILAVIVTFFSKIWPFNFKNKNEPIIKKDIMSIWFKVVVACIPGAIVTLLFDDFIEQHLHTPLVIASMLIIYGILFIVIENYQKKKSFRVTDISKITYKIALLIGLFQVLSIIPGTSRSGATIIGALLLGVNRVVASEFTFFLAVPVMLGLSFIKLVKHGLIFTFSEIALLLVGVITAFLVSLLVIKFLMSYIKKKDFKIFGVYRIILGLIIIGYFTIFI